MRFCNCVLVVCFIAFAAPIAESGMPGYEGEHFLADLVTDECVFFFSMPQPVAAHQDINALKLMGLAQEPEVQALWQNICESLDKRLGELVESDSPQLAKHRKRYLEVFDRQISLAVFRTKEITGIYSPIGNLAAGLLLGDAVALLESSSSPELVAQAVRDFASGTLAKAVWGGSFREVEIEGQTAYESLEDSLPLYLACKGGVVVAATRKERLESLLAAFDAPPKNPLSARPDYRKAMAETGDGEVTIFLYWNIEESLRRLAAERDEEEREDFEEVVRAFRMSALWAAWRGDGERAQFHVRLQRAEGQGGMLDAFRPAFNPLDTTAVVPSSAFVYGSQMVDAMKLCKHFLHLYEKEEFGPSIPETGPQAERWAKFQATSKTITLVASSLGPEAAFCANIPFGGGLIPNAAIVCQAKDPVTLEDDLRSLLKIAKLGEFNESQYLGYTVYSAPERELPFGLCYAVLEGHLVLGLTPLAVKEVIALQKNPAGSLKQSAEFEAAFKGLPEERQGAFYLNTRNIALFLYNIIAPILTGVAVHAPEDSIFDPALLPVPATIGRHLDKLVAVAVVDEQGMVIRGYSDGLDLLTVTGLCALHVPLYGPFVVIDVREELGHACMTQLYRLIQPPARETLPATQVEFLKEYFDGGRELVCPLDRDPRDLGGGYRTSFRYFIEEFGVQMEYGGWEGRPELRSDLILYEDAQRHGRRTVLTRARFPASLPEEEFQTMLQAQKERYGVK